ncbi:MAG: hypothetical protein ACC661_12885, partial [Verrucomicrobiales bacterium]
RRANIPAIPSLGLSYFDPGSGEFVELFSEPIPVTVSRAATVDAFDAVFSDGSRLKNELRASRRGVHHNYVGAGVLLAARPEGWLRGRSGFWVILIIVPPLLFGVFYLTTLRSRREKSDPGAARARRAYGVFLRAARGVEGCSDPVMATVELQAAVAGYVADRFGLVRGAVSGEEVARYLRLRAADSKAVDAVESFYDLAGSMRYSPRGRQAVPADELRQKIPAAVERIERGLKS